MLRMIKACFGNLLFSFYITSISFLPKYLTETRIAKADIITAHGTNGNNDSVLPVSVVVTYVMRLTQHNHYNNKDILSIKVY